MIHITEKQSSTAISHEIAYEAVHRALIAATSPKATIFPVVQCKASDPQNKFSVKSASDSDLAGLKVGSYFATNDAVGLPRHNSIILLFDQAKGQVGAVVEAGKLNAYRTAAANAVATDALARQDSQVLALFGTGHQAIYEAQAIARIRPLSKIMVVGRTVERTNLFVTQLLEKGLPAEAAEAEKACQLADIIVTVTTATEPLFQADWVRPGTHISCMGVDAIGKQELPPELFARSNLFCDLPEQSARIGEFQHATADAHLSAIGDILIDSTKGRNTPEEITIFDSSGIALQDLYVAESIIAALGS